MALTITFDRTDNSVKVSGDSTDDGKLKVLYNDSVIYNNLSGSSDDIVAGSRKSIPLPLVSGKIQKGVYRFVFEDSVGSDDYDLSAYFNIDDAEVEITETIDTTAPSFVAEDDTNWSIDNATIARVITVTGAASGSENLTLTLNSVAYTIALTSGTVEHNANEITTWLNNTSNQTVWAAVKDYDKVVIYQNSAGALDGTFTFSSSTATGTIKLPTRTLTTSYPAGVPETIQDLSGVQYDITDDLSTSTYLLYEGAMQTDIQATLDYYIASTTGFTIQSTSTRTGFVFTTKVSGYSQSPKMTTNSVSDLYECVESLREKVETARLNDRSSYTDLRLDYMEASSLLSQYKEAIYTGIVADLDELKTAIERLTDCEVSASKNNSTPKRIYGLGIAGTVDNVSKVEVVISASQMVALNTTPISILSTDSSFAYTPISASVICSTAQASGTPSSALTLKLHQGSTYDTTEEIMSCVVPTTVDAAGDFANFEVISGDKLSASGEGIYLGAAADDAGWDGVFKIVFYYSVTKVS